MMILLTMLICFMFVSFLLLSINIMIYKKKNSDREKKSSFECGFDLFTSPRLPFSIQFYLISIIFLIFDIEIIIFLPIISSFSSNLMINWSTTSLIFIMILLMGLYMEWNNGALKWLK